jgi:hypothetical protein
VHRHVHRQGAGRQGKDPCGRRCILTTGLIAG